MKTLLSSLLLCSTLFAALDSHTHFLSHEPHKFEDYLKVSKLNGINHSFVLSMAYGAAVRTLLSPDTLSFHEFIKRENDYVADLQQKYPNSVTGFCSIPWGLERKLATEELDRCVKLGLKGLKVYPVKFFMTGKKTYNALNIRFDSNRAELNFLNLLIDFAEKHELIFGIHSSQIDTSALVGFLYQSNYRYASKMKLIFFHGFAPQPLAVLNFFRDFIKSKPGVKAYVEMSSAEAYLSGPLKDTYIKLMQSLPVENILFGSDAISWDKYTKQKKELSSYEQIFTQEQMKLILSGNGVLD